MRILQKIGWRFTVVLGLGGLVACATSTKPQEITATKERQFLVALHALINQPPMTVAKISSTFGWRVVETVKEFDRTYIDFNEYPSERRLNPRLVLEDKTDRKSFSRDFPEDGFCLRSADVIAEFGKSFNPTPLIVELPSMDFKSLPINVQKDYAIFKLGPRYSIDVKKEKIEIYFQFFFSQCANSVFVISTKSNGSTK
jgi:hypothetical protein